MTRTAISPRLAIRTLREHGGPVAMLEAHRLGHPPLRGDRLHQHGGCSPRRATGAPEGLVAVADHQTAGRGRLGRTWVAPAGASLLMSVLLRPDLAPERRHLVTAAVALAGAARSTTWLGSGPS